MKGAVKSGGVGWCRTEPCMTVGRSAELMCARYRLPSPAACTPICWRPAPRVRRAPTPSSARWPATSVGTVDRRWSPPASGRTSGCTRGSGVRLAEVRPQVTVRGLPRDRRADHRTRGRSHGHRRGSRALVAQGVRVSAALRPRRDAVRPVQHARYLVPEDRLARRLTQACDANVNYVRVWDGGRYESEDFYDLADDRAAAADRVRSGPDAAVLARQPVLGHARAAPERSGPRHDAHLGRVEHRRLRQVPRVPAAIRRRVRVPGSARVRDAAALLDAAEPGPQPRSTRPG